MGGPYACGTSGTQMGLAHINTGGSGKDAAPTLKPPSLDSKVMVESYLPSLSLSGSMSLMGGEKKNERFIQLGDFG